MMSLKPLSSFLKRFAEDEEASATVEFVILAPTVMWIVFSVIEAGWMMTQQSMLNRGLSLAMRDLRLGRVSAPTSTSVKQDICDYAGILRDCMDTITLELIPFQSFVPGQNAVCVDRSSVIEPTVTYNPGSHLNQDIVVARVCFVVDPLIPGAGLGAALPKDPTGAFHLVSYSAFVNEPA